LKLRAHALRTNRMTQEWLDDTHTRLHARHAPRIPSTRARYTGVSNTHPCCDTLNERCTCSKHNESLCRLVHTSISLTLQPCKTMRRCVLSIMLCQPTNHLSLPGRSLPEQCAFPARSPVPSSMSMRLSMLAWCCAFRRAPVNVCLRLSLSSTHMFMSHALITPCLSSTRTSMPRASAFRLRVCMFVVCFRLMLLVEEC
jgi:hypothetical protein